MKKTKKKQHKDKLASTEKTLELGNIRVKEQFGNVPEIRWDKVSNFRRMLAEKDWNPDSEEIAEKILLEHLS